MDLTVLKIPRLAGICAIDFFQRPMDIFEDFLHVDTWRGAKNSELLKRTYASNGLFPNSKPALLAGKAPLPAMGSEIM